MTVATGSPDFQALTMWRGAPILAQAYSVTTGAPLTAAAQLSNWASLQVKCTAGNNEGVQFIIDYYTDAAKTFHIGQFTWQIWAAALQAVVPVLGPYAVVTVKTNNAGPNGGDVYVAPTNVPVPKPQYPAGFVQQENQNLSVPANTTLQFALGDIVVGPAFLFARALDSSAKLQIFVNDLDDTGARSGTLMENDALSGDITLNSWARERVLQVNIFNFDTVAAHPLAFRLAAGSQ